jgi:hypothetical protein
MGSKNPISTNYKATHCLLLINGSYNGHVYMMTSTTYSLNTLALDARWQAIAIIKSSCMRMTQSTQNKPCIQIFYLYGAEFVLGQPAAFLLYVSPLPFEQMHDDVSSGLTVVAAVILRRRASKNCSQQCDKAQHSHCTYAGASRQLFDSSQTQLLSASVSPIAVRNRTDECRCEHATANENVT